MTKRKKIIIDTDPGVDDAYAIALALQAFSEDVEVIGVTTIFGNVRRDDATTNAKILIDGAVARDGDAHRSVPGAKIPVVDGAKVPLAQLPQGDALGVGARDAEDASVFVADFVHGTCGFGGVRDKYAEVFLKPDGAHEYVYDEGVDAADFIAKTCAEFPGEVSVLALASLTNLALTFRRHPACLRDMDELIVLGGAFGVNGNVNPAAEANILGDPEAADEVLSTFSRCYVVGLDVTTRLTLSGAHIDQLAHAKGVDARGVVRDDMRAFLHAATQFYKAYHVDVANFDGIYMHDPTALLLAIPRMRHLFTFREGAVRVVTQGITRGQTVLDVRGKWPVWNEWSEKSRCRVALDVDVQAASRVFFHALGIDAILDTE